MHLKSIKAGRIGHFSGCKMYFFRVRFYVRFGVWNVYRLNRCLAEKLAQFDNFWTILAFSRPYRVNVNIFLRYDAQVWRHQGSTLWFTRWKLIKIRGFLFRIQRNGNSKKQKWRVFWLWELLVKNHWYNKSYRNDFSTMSLHRPFWTICLEIVFVIWLIWRTLT